MSSIVKAHAKHISDPKKFGPGKWHTLHELATFPMFEENPDLYMNMIPQIFANIPCLECRSHALANLETIPPAKYRDYIYHGPDSRVKGRKIGMFVWSVLFHNHVNGQLGKPQLSLEEAIMLFYPFNEGDVVCTSCGNDKDKSDYPITILDNDEQFLTMEKPVEKSSTKPRVIFPLSVPFSVLGRR